MEASEETIKQQIEDCVAVLTRVLPENILGAYVYGSLLLGGLQKYSDIDVLAIAKRDTKREEKEQLAKALLEISGMYAVSMDRKPIELIILTYSDVHPWKYPPKFDFHYGEWLRKDFEAGNIEPWSTKESSNLALTITQLLLSHKTLFGMPPDQLLEPIPYIDFFNASTSEIESVLSDLDWDTRNVILSLARIWCTLETDTIQSKSNAASYAIGKLPEEYEPVVSKAKSILLGEAEGDWKELDGKIRPCAEYMVAQIYKRMEIIRTSNYTDRIITLG